MHTFRRLVFRELLRLGIPGNLVMLLAVLVQRRIRIAFTENSRVILDVLHEGYPLRRDSATHVKHPSPLSATIASAARRFPLLRINCRDKRHTARVTEVRNIHSPPFARNASDRAQKIVG